MMNFISSDSLFFQPFFFSLYTFFPVNMKTALAITRTLSRRYYPLHPEEQEEPEKNYLDGIQTSEQREWDFECVHQQTGERRWFHIVAMGSEVDRKKKYILVMSDRTVEQKQLDELHIAITAQEEE